MSDGRPQGGEDSAADPVETASVDAAHGPPLFLVKGDATPEEVAALTVVLQGIAAASAPAPEPEVISEWSAHHRKLRPAYPAGPGGWRSSGLPR